MKHLHMGGLKHLPPVVRAASATVPSTFGHSEHPSGVTLCCKTNAGRIFGGLERVEKEGDGGEGECDILCSFSTLSGLMARLVHAGLWMHTPGMRTYVEM